jgi:hypothetical protein
MDKDKRHISGHAQESSKVSSQSDIEYSVMWYVTGQSGGVMKFVANQILSTVSCDMLLAA